MTEKSLGNPELCLRIAEAGYKRGDPAVRMGGGKAMQKGTAIVRAE